MCWCLFGGRRQAPAALKLFAVFGVPHLSVDAWRHPAQQAPSVKTDRRTLCAPPLPKYTYPMKINDIQWKSLVSGENQWYPTKIMDIWRKSMISYQNHWYPTKIIDILRKSIISAENQWYPTKMIDIRRKSLISNENQWYPKKIIDIL